jgi:lysophospholipase L1-like esterase
MKVLVTLLIISIAGNLIGVFVLYKFFAKNNTLKETQATLREKDRTLDEVNRRLDKRLVFVHHSVGHNWLSEGGLRDALIARGIAVRSVTYGNPIGQDTDMRHWVPKFHNDLDRILKFDQPPNTPFRGTEENDIVMFKSCYPNSNIIADGEGDGNPTDTIPTLANYKAVMNQLAPIFAARPNKTFIYVTSPPLVPGATTAENAQRARTFDNWVKTDFLNGYKQYTGQSNLLVFDLFDILADSTANTLKSQYQISSDDSHPNAAGSRAATKAFLAFLDEHGITAGK